MENTTVWKDKKKKSYFCKHYDLKSEWHDGHRELSEPTKETL